MIPEGRYGARAMNWRAGTTRGGSAQVGVMFRLADGRTIPWYGFFSERALPVTVAALTAMGWEGDDISDIQGLGDRDVEIVVEHEVRDGRTRHIVRWVNPGETLYRVTRFRGERLTRLNHRIVETRDALAREHGTRHRGDDDSVPDPDPFNGEDVGFGDDHPA